MNQQALDAYDKRTVGGVQKHRTSVFPLKGATLMRIAASIAIVSAIGFFANSMLNPTRVLAFEEVARAILKIKNASFEIDAGVAGTSKFIIHFPGRMRVTDSDGAVVIVDVTAGKMLEIEPDRKVAVLVDGLSDAADAGQLEDFLTETQNHLRRAEKSENFGDVNYARLGERQIDGKLAIGYRVSDPGEADFDTVEIWADPQTALPIQLDYTMVVGEERVVSTLKNFKYNQKLDP